MIDEQENALPTASVTSMSDSEWHITHPVKEIGPVSLAEPLDKSVFGEVDGGDDPRWFPFDADGFEKVVAGKVDTSPASNAEWHVIQDGKEFGPMLLAELVDKAAIGKISADDLVKQTGGLWTKARDFSFLKQFLGNPSRKKAELNSVEAAKDSDGPLISKKELAIWVLLAVVGLILWGVLCNAVKLPASPAVVPQAQLPPKDARYYSIEGEISMLWDEYEKAIKNYDEAIRLDPKNAKAFSDRGEAWAKMKNYDNAIKDYDEAIRLNPNDSLVFWHRATAWSKKREYENAIKDLDEVIRLEPKTLWAYHDRGVAWLGKKDYDRAIKDFDVTVRLNPQNALFYYDRSSAWLGKRNYDNAIKDLDKAIHLDPDYELAFNKRGNAWSLKKDYSRAIKDYEEAIHLDPGDPLFYSDLAWLLSTCPEKKIRDGKRAIQLATKACDLTNWKEYLDLDTLAAAYAEVGQFEEAERYQRKVLDSPAFLSRDGGEFRQRLELYKRKIPYRENPLDFSLEPTYGAVTVRFGLPDPYVVNNLIAGGPIQTMRAGKSGWFSQAPAFKLYYTASASLPLTIHVKSTANSILLVNLPDGTWIADVNSDGNLNPLLKFYRPQSGRYDIWVGTFTQDIAKSTLKITEGK